jgi:hypothetical protein
MKISHECPLSLLESSLQFNDYQYLLPTLWYKYPEYKQFMLNYRQQPNSFIIADNGIFEGEVRSVQEQLDLINEIQPDIYIVPDEWNEAIITAKNAKYWKQFVLPERTKLMVVLQGKTVNEIHLLYQTCIDLGYTHFAFNHSSIVYQELGGSENKLANQSVGRVMLIEYFRSQNVIKDHHVLHLLGCSTPQEFTYYRDNCPDLIKSVDTSNPIITGALKQRYSDVGLLTKPENKIEEFMEKDLAPQLEDIIFNINKFKEFCNGK